MGTANAIRAVTEPGAERAGADWLGRLRRAWSEHRAFRTTLTELSALSDRELADLGLHRSELRAVARTAAYRI